MAMNDNKVSSSTTDIVGTLVSEGYLQSKVKSSKTGKDFVVSIDSTNGAITIKSGSEDGAEVFYPTN